MNDAAVAEVERRTSEWMDPTAGMASAPGVRPDSVNLTIDYVEPDTVDAATAVQLTVHGKGVAYDGQGFAVGCAAYVNGVACPTTSVGLTENIVQVSVGADVCPSAGAVDVFVRNPSGIQSEPVQLTVTGGARFVYAFDGGTGVPTGPGQVRFESADQANPGTIWITSVDADGDDNGNALGSMPIPGVIRLEDQADSSNWNEYVYQGGAVTADGYALPSPIHWNAGAPLVAGSLVGVTFRPYP